MTNPTPVNCVKACGRLSFVQRQRSGLSVLRGRRRDLWASVVSVKSIAFMTLLRSAGFVVQVLVLRVRSPSPVLPIASLGGSLALQLHMYNNDRMWSAVGDHRRRNYSLREKPYLTDSRCLEPRAATTRRSS